MPLMLHTPLRQQPHVIYADDLRYADAGRALFRRRAAFLRCRLLLLLLYAPLSATLSPFFRYAIHAFRHYTKATSAITDDDAATPLSPLRRAAVVTPPLRRCSPLSPPFHAAILITLALRHCCCRRCRLRVTLTTLPPLCCACRFTFRAGCRHAAAAMLLMMLRASPFFAADATRALLTLSMFTMPLQC